MTDEKRQSDAAGRKTRRESGKRHRAERDSFLETVESLIVAFILAFVFRAYVVEAFVIPTGSMAPRLNGQHAEFVCGNCGHPYRVGLDANESGSVSHRVVLDTVCPLCFSREVTSRTVSQFVGDRILVLKYFYDFFAPQRWDVIVFKFPTTPAENYIKRLVGLPGETVEIRGGDVYITPPQDADEPVATRIATKPDRAQRALWMPVGDTDYWDEKNGPQWRPESPASDAWRWDRMPLEFAGRDETMSYLVYHHFGGDGRRVPIKDFYAYDDPANGNGRSDNAHVVTDLNLVADVELSSPGTVAIVLTARADTFRFVLPSEGLGEGGRIFHNGVIVASGASATVPVGRKVRLEAANVDRKLILKVDGRRVIDLDDNGRFTEADDWSYDKPLVAAARWSGQPEEASRVAIGAQGAKATIHRLRVCRDIYYTSSLRGRGRTGFGVDGEPYRLNADEFFVAGDNSPRSLDSRWWEDSPVVPRKNLVGKAFFVYWPAAGSRYGIALPFVPDLTKFRFIR